MPTPGSTDNPLRVAIIGSGPAGFYTVSSLLKADNISVSIDMFERLPTPFGLVRAGVAPDHQKDKSVVNTYHRLVQDAPFRFYGNVEYGRHLSLDDLRQHYHQVVFATGAQRDRNLEIPGANLLGSHSATDFVAWYNGHPDHVDDVFDLSVDSAAIVGLGNVAVDVARILCKSQRELEGTDIADHALHALAKSRIKTVYILGRRGPAQAAFTPPEIREMSDLETTNLTISPDEARLDTYSQNALANGSDKNMQKNVELIEQFSQQEMKDKQRQLIIRFLVSPTEVLGDARGHVNALQLVRNEMYLATDGSLKARATQTVETLPTGLLFRSVGYRGVPLADIPFDEQRGTLFNQAGRVTDSSGKLLTGLYVAGWIKRGPSGVIGTNKTDARETVQCLLEDLSAGLHFEPESPAPDSVDELIRSRQPDVVSYDDWLHIDKIEIARGLASNRPRVKFTRVADMLAALQR